MWRFVFMLWVGVSCEIDQERVNISRKKISGPIQVAELVTIDYKDSGTLKARLSSPKIEYYTDPDPRLLMPKGLSVDFFLDDKTKPHSTLEAGWGLRYEKQHTTWLKNNVVVVNIEQDTLQAEDLVWDEKAHIIRSDKFVRIKKKEEILYGVGFESDEDLTHYKIFNIKGTIYRDRGTFE